MPGDAAPAPDAAADAPPADAAPLVCPVDCAPVEGVELCFCSALVDWPAARAACDAAGLVLARIDNPTDAAAVREISTSLGGTTSVSPWLGGSDRALEGEWRWLDGDDVFWEGLFDGAPPAGQFADFEADEPNQFQGTEEDCLQGVSTGWNDLPCDLSRPYLCGRSSSI